MSLELSPDVHRVNPYDKGRNTGLGAIPEQPHRQMDADKLTMLPRLSDIGGEAKQVMPQEMPQDDKLQSSEHLESLISMDNLAFSLYGQGKSKQAELILREALTTREKLLGKEDPLTVMSMSNLALSLHQQGKSKEAEPLFREVLTAREKLLGKEDPFTVTTISNLGLSLYGQGKSKEAEPMLREALTAREKLLGKEDPLTVMSMSNLALSLYEQGRSKEAEPIFREVLTAREKLLGKEDPLIVTNMSNLALSLYEQGKSKEAEPIFREVLIAREKLLGKEDPLIVTSMSDLALSLYQQGKSKEAEPMFQEVLTAREKLLGKEDPLTVTSMNDLALSLYEQGKSKEAELIFREVLTAREKLLGKEDPLTVTSMNDLALSLYQQGKSKEAEPMFQEVLTAREKLPGKEDPLMVLGNNNSSRYQKSTSEAELNDSGSTEKQGKDHALTGPTSPSDSEVKDIVRSQITLSDLNPAEGMLQSQEPEEHSSLSLIVETNLIKDTEIKAQDPRIEIESPRQQVNTQEPHLKSSSFLALASSLTFLVRGIFASTDLPEGITRIKWTCRCGHISHDDFPLNFERAKTFEDDFRHSQVLRRVEITNKRPGLLYEWMLLLHNVIIRPIWQYISSDSSNPGSSSSESLDNSSVDSQSSASGSNLPTLLDDSGDIGATKLSRGKRKFVLNRKPVEANRKHFLHVCIDVGRIKCLEVIELDPQDPSSDQELFRRLKTIHEKQFQRGYNFFLKLQAIRFVQFELWRHGRIDHLLENRLPKNTVEYEFLRKPGWKEGDPIHLPTLLLHLYNKPEDFGDDSAFLLRVPKRKGERLIYRPLTKENSLNNIGYGIHLQQGPAEIRFQAVVVIVAAVVAVLVSPIIDRVLGGEQLSFPWAVCGFLWGIFIALLNLWKEWFKERYGMA